MKIFLVDAPIECDDPTLIEAPSFGVACEYFMACHGLMGAMSITAKEYDPAPETPVEGWDKVKGLFFDHEPTAEKIRILAEDLDEHYKGG